MARAGRGRTAVAPDGRRPSPTTGAHRHAGRHGVVAGVLLVIGVLVSVGGSTGAGATSPGPTVASFTPTDGLSAGGTLVVITGTGLTRPPSNSTAPRPRSPWDSTTQIGVLTPAHAPGAADISVTTAGGTTFTTTGSTTTANVAATWSGSPDTSCGQWSTSTPPAGAVTAVATLSGAGGGGSGYNHGEHPTGGDGDLVSTTLTPAALASTLSVETGCGGGRARAVWSTPTRTGPRPGVPGSVAAARAGSP